MRTKLLRWTGAPIREQVAHKVTLNRISVLKTGRDSGPDRYGTIEIEQNRVLIEIPAPENGADLRRPVEEGGADEKHGIAGGALCSAVAKRTADAIDGLRWQSQSGWNI